ncbi:MAG: hypothetical protein APG08_00394 [Candidatus Methanofastidiosum methylothiophilum]|uniref:Uncharacterized protein n=1 Tax=Candidatus Methanofastidiosum methylothiophilum TaxID=1705564 RepID=A0A150JDF1_9EURY|nr:MAG: hypothetical protein AN188_00246 [Candidatus Methanofastidiosum methylthiophilus]KYC57113.1 MAG: hypothetical protein APG08_00394 [Candidatus Methanofastidiosum methylthiophilus]
MGMKKRNKERMDVGILDLLMIHSGKELTASEISKSVDLGHCQVVQFLKILRKHKDEKRPYTKYFSMRQIPNSVTHINQWVYAYDENN